MRQATVALWAGAVLSGLFGYIVVKALLTDSIWVRKMVKEKNGWRLKYWQMPRTENPTAFWMNIALSTLFGGFGLFMVAWALISPETVH